MKKISKALRKFVDDASTSDAYWVESAKLQFAVRLERRRRAAGLSYKAVAEKLGTSAAYISKVFRGDTNVTIESMVKLARATGGHLDIQIPGEAVEPQQWIGKDCFNFIAQTGKTPHITVSSSSVLDLTLAAATNDAAYDVQYVA